ncbi:MAG: twin-arginine translocation signal domain-containing protein, partial [Sedimentisphaerales bacterium]
MQTQKKGKTRREFLGGVAATAGLLSIPRRLLMPIEAQAAPDSKDRQRIEAAIPKKAFATPRRPRKLLIFDLNVGYGGHGSIPAANTAFTLMGKRTGAFETVVSKDPSA